MAECVSQWVPQLTLLCKIIIKILVLLSVDVVRDQAALNEIQLNP